MKRYFILLFSSFLILSACDNDFSLTGDNKKEQNDTNNNKDNIKEKEDNHISKSDKNSIEHNDKTTQNQNTSNEQTSNEEIDSKDTIEDVSSHNNNQIDFSNIKDKSTLESIIYGNYSEEQKIQAYNSAVANGIIPQGNVMEGPASVAYQSSLRVENGQEKSIYDRPNESDVSINDENASSDPNAEINAAETEDEYYDALRKKYNGGLSSGELQTKHAIEQG
ncbi:hypothetical protein M3C31_01200 [Staphylococcus hominis]|uniref:hypothetical protein n=1 Tax=Staphylococcus hominis TaxID=1290 RepID=UPI0021A7EC44|nr:hypothetical protein [Staphylococcus hominis]MCT1482466.1 hypothetical protein [Staphylococcus hominis]